MTITGRLFPTGVKGSSTGVWDKLVPRGFGHRFRRSGQTLRTGGTAWTGSVTRIAPVFQQDGLYLGMPAENFDKLLAAVAAKADNPNRSCQ